MCSLLDLVSLVLIIKEGVVLVAIVDVMKIDPVEGGAPKFSISNRQQ